MLYVADIHPVEREETRISE